MTYNRLALRHYTDGDVKKVLRLPFADISSPSISNTVDIKKFKKTAVYYPVPIKSLSRRYNITITGVLKDDAVSYELDGLIPDTDYMTIEEYKLALENLDPVITYTFDTRTGSMLINSIFVESFGLTRKFRIEGTVLC